MPQHPAKQLATPHGMNAVDFTIEAIPNEFHGEGWQGEREQNPWLGFLWPLLLSTAGGVLCYWAAVADTITLGLFLGGLVIVALITGPLVAGEDTWLGRGLAWGGAVHGVAGIWLLAILTTEQDLDFGLWAASYLVLAAMAFAIGGLAILLRSMGIGRALAGGIVTVLSIAWLTWPIWLAAAITGHRGERIAGWLVPAHPVFAVNGVLRESMGVWTEQAIAYHVTSLNDEVPYSLPDNVGWALLLHSVVGGLAVGGAVAITRKPKTLLKPDATGLS